VESLITVLLPFNMRLNMRPWTRQPLVHEAPIPEKKHMMLEKHIPCNIDTILLGNFEEPTKETMRPPSLDTLPTEILLDIYEYFEDNEDLQRMALVSKAFYEITIPLYYRIIDFRVLHSGFLFEDLKKLSRFGKHVRYMTVTGQLSNTNDAPAPPWMKNVAHGVIVERQVCRYGEPDKFNPDSPDKLIAGGFLNVGQCDQAFSRLAEAIETSMSGLRYLAWHSVCILPPCILVALEVYRPNCRLHISKFWLNSLRGSLEADEHDYRLATSPSLYSIHSTIEPSKNTKIDYTANALWDMINGLAPNLKRVSLGWVTFRDEFWYDDSKRLPWPGLKPPEGYSPVRPVRAPKIPKAPETPRVPVTLGAAAQGGTLERFLTKNIKSDRLRKLIGLEPESAEEEEEEEEEQEVEAEASTEVVLPVAPVTPKPAALECFRAEYIKVDYLPTWYTIMDTSRLKMLELTNPLKKSELLHMVDNCDFSSVETLTVHLLNFDPRLNSDPRMDMNLRLRLNPTTYDTAYTEATVKLLAKMPALSAVKVIGQLMKPVFDHILDKHGHKLRKLHYHRYESFPTYIGQMVMNKWEKRCIKLWCPKLEELLFKKKPWEKISLHFEAN
jgi:hypothetical protein